MTMRNTESSFSSQLRIAVIEDNPADAFLLKKRLRQAGFNGPLHLFGAIAEFPTEANPEVLLLDLELPDASGIEGVHRIRSTHPRLPIVVLTGTDDFAVSRACVESGAQDFLNKDRVDMQSLRRSLLYAVSREREAEVGRLNLRLRNTEQLRKLARCSVAIAGVESVTALLTMVARAARDLFDGAAASAHIDDQHSVDPAATRLDALPAARARLRTASSSTEQLGKEDGGEPRHWVGARLAGEAGALLVFRAGSGFGVDDQAMLEQLAELASGHLELLASHCALRRARERLTTANRELQALVFAVSHSLLAPLRASETIVGFLREDLGRELDGEVGENLGLLSSRIARMERMLADLREYAELLERAPGSGCTLSSGDLREKLADRWATPGWSLRWAADEVVVEHDADLLLRLLELLLDNASKHRRPDSRGASVALRQDGPWLHVTVADDGKGIAPRYQERVFALFETLQSRDETEGSGMGLALAKKIVERVGGQLTLRSDGASGTTVTVRWPLTD